MQIYRNLQFTYNYTKVEIFRSERVAIVSGLKSKYFFDSFTAA